MKTCIMIPARLASQRFPGKMLHEIHGRPLLYWTWLQAMRAGFPVFVVSSDHEILVKASGWGAKVIDAYARNNGTERCASALKEIGCGFDIVVNWQGDSPVTPQHFARDMVEMLTGSMQYDVVTCAQMQDRQDGIVKVVEASGMAAHFLRLPADDVIKFTLAHIGLYAIRGDALRRYGTIPVPEEQRENLEQLRWKHIGFPIAICVPTAPHYRIEEVNYPEDVAKIEPVLGEIHEIA